MIDSVGLRLRVILAVALVLGASLAGVCPACEHAELADSSAQTAGAPMAGHECCERVTPADRGSRDASSDPAMPDSTAPTAPGSCAHESVKLMLEAAAPDRAVALDVAAVISPPALAPMAEFRPVAAVLDVRAAANPSPPALLVLPIRI